MEPQTSKVAHRMTGLGGTIGIVALASIMGLLLWRRKSTSGDQLTDLVMRYLPDRWAADLGVAPDDVRRAIAEGRPDSIAGLGRVLHGVRLDIELPLGMSGPVALEFERRTLSGDRERLKADTTWEYLPDDVRAEIIRTNAASVRREWKCTT